MQPSADLWQTLCSDLQEQRGQVRREEYSRVARDFLTAARQLLRAGSPRLGDACEIAGDICSEAGTPLDAVEFYQEAYAIATASGVPSISGRISGKLAELLSESGEEYQAASFYEKAVRHFDDAGDHSQHMPLLNALASVRRKCGDFKGATRAYLQGIAILTRMHGPQCPEVALLYNNLGVALTEEGDFTAAEDAHLQALAVREHVFGATHPEVAHSLLNIGVVNHLRGEPTKARRFYIAAQDIYKNFSPPDSPELTKITENLRRLSNRSSN